MISKKKGLRTRTRFVFRNTVLYKQVPTNSRNTRSTSSTRLYHTNHPTNYPVLATSPTVCYLALPCPTAPHPYRTVPQPILRSSDDTYMARTLLDRQTRAQHCTVYPFFTQLPSRHDWRGGKGAKCLIFYEALLVLFDDWYNSFFRHAIVIHRRLALFFSPVM